MSMSTRPTRRPLPPPPPPRSSREHIRRMVRQHEEFDPERPPTWRGSSRDLVTNGSNLDRLLDRVQAGKSEVTIDAEGYTPAQVERIKAAARARGLNVSGTGRWLLIRDLRDMNQKQFNTNPGGFEKQLEEIVGAYYGKLRTDLSEPEVVDELYRAFKNEDTSDALERANELLEGHGVEALGGYSGGDPQYLYINFGDTYDPTILWSRENNKVFVAMGGWGTVWEEEGEGDAVDGRLFLERVRIDRGGYDPQGRYYGTGKPLFRVSDELATIDREFRAEDRKAAIAQVRIWYPRAKVR